MIRRSVNYALQIDWASTLKRVLWLVVPIFLAFSGLVMYLIYDYTKTEVALGLEARLLSNTRAGEQVAREKFQVTQDELFFFSRLSANRGMARALAGGGIDPTTDVVLNDWIRNFNDVAFQYVNAKSRIRQIRIVLATPEGEELVKLKRAAAGGLESVPPESLEAKGDYPYMLPIRQLALNEVYWSPITLNVENKVIERPHQPTLRGATPIPDDAGEIWAYLIINYDAEQLLNDLVRTFNKATYAQLYAYRPDGHFVFHPEPGRAFQHEFAPELAVTYEQEFLIEKPNWLTKTGLTLATRRADGAQFVALQSSPEPYEELTADERGRFAIHIPMQRFQHLVLESAVHVMLVVLITGLLFTATLTFVMLRTARQKDIANALGFQSSWQQAESDALIALMLDKLPVAMAMFDANMHYLAVSERWCQEYGVQAKDLIGRDHQALFPHMRNAFKNLYQQALAGKPADVTECLIDKAGNEFSVRWRIEPWHRLDGAVAGIVVLSYRLDDN